MNREEAAAAYADEYTPRLEEMLTALTNEGEMRKVMARMLAQAHERGGLHERDALIEHVNELITTDVPVMMEPSAIRQIYETGVAQGVASMKHTVAQRLAPGPVFAVQWTDRHSGHDVAGVYATIERARVAIDNLKKHYAPDAVWAALSAPGDFPALVEGVEMDPPDDNPHGWISKHEVQS